MNYFFNSFENYGNFNGRARRSEFWYFHLFYFISLVVSGAISVLTGLIFLLGITWLAFIIPLITVGVRRMHDVGKSGWYIFFPFYSMILALSEGDKGDNYYGSDPKEEINIEELGTN